MKKIRAWLLACGTFVSSVMLAVFYFTFFALFAISYRLLRGSAAPVTSFRLPRRQFTALDDFRKEF